MGAPAPAHRQLSCDTPCEIGHHGYRQRIVIGAIEFALSATAHRRAIPKTRNVARCSLPRLCPVRFVATIAAISATFAISIPIEPDRTAGDPRWVELVLGVLVVVDSTTLDH